jgi:TetR/AcrR family transcriptional regulator, cholesterol catabolism regulator
MSEKTQLETSLRSNRKVENMPKEDKPRVRLSQQKIVAAAADLFARNGFGATSLDDIGEALGVTKGALYYHIKNKEEILKLIFMTVLTVSEEPLRQIVQAELPPTEKLRRAIFHHVAVAADRSPAMLVFYREDVHLTGPFAREIAARKKAYERLFEKIIEEGIALGQFRPEADPRIATFGILGMCNWLSQWYRPGRAYNPQQIALIFSQMTEFGLVVTPAEK